MTGGVLQDKSKDLNKLRRITTFSGRGDSNVENNCGNLMRHLDSFGPKFSEIYYYVTTEAYDKHWIYCGLSRGAGVRPMYETLLCKKWTQIEVDNVKQCSGLLKDTIEMLKNNKNVSLPGKDYKRFVVLESSTPKTTSSMALEILNHPKNVSGKLIRVIIGDKSRKEGMDLFSIKHVHIVSTEPNYTDWHQAVSRAVRYCSFRYEKSVSDWKVNVYTYLSHDEESTLNENNLWLRNYNPLDIETHILQEAGVNRYFMSRFMNALKEGAIDCYITSGFHKKENIKCDMKVPKVQKKRPPRIPNEERKKAYNEGYKKYNYNKGYVIGAKLKKSPSRSLVENKKIPKNEYKRHKFYGEQNAKFNAIVNGYRQL